MRFFKIISLAVAATLVTLPSTVAAQASELPCLGYATFERDASGTQLMGLALGDVPGGSKVTLLCTGSSCPFASKEFNIKNDVKTLALTDMFLNPSFKAGTTIEMRVTKPGWVGKVFQYEIRDANDPRSTTKCLPPDGSKPIVCLKEPKPYQR